MALMKAYAAVLTTILPTYPMGMPSREAIRQVKQRLQAAGRDDLPPKFSATVRSAYNRQCEGYAEFEKNRAPEERPFFRSVRRGHWALHPDFSRLPPDF